MGGLGNKEFCIMYHYIEDKEFLKRMRSLCADIINQLVQKINREGKMTVEAHLVGSGARNMETQNANQPVDLDYNLWVYKCDDINDCRAIKEYVRKTFNKVLKANGWSDCEDSTSSLTTERRHFTKGNQTEFSIDLAIVAEGRPVPPKVALRLTNKQSLGIERSKISFIVYFIHFLCRGKHFYE